MREIRYRLQSLGLSLWLGLSAALCYDYGLAERWEHKLLALLPPPPETDLSSPRVVQSSSAEQSTRLDYALFFRALKDRPPTLTLIDLPLHDADALSTTYDSQLFEQLRGYNRIIYGFPLVRGEEEATSAFLPPAPIIKGPIDQLPHYTQALLPGEMFRSLGTLAAANFPASGPAGRVPLLFSYQGNVLPSLALAGLIAQLGGDWTQSEIRPGRSIHVRSPDQKTLAVIPIDAAGNVTLRPMESRDLDLMPVELADVILASEQILNGEPPIVDLEELRRDILLVGLGGGAGNTSDIRAQATVLRSLLQQAFLHRAHDQATAGLLLALCIVAGQIAVCRTSHSLLGIGLLLLVIISSGFWLIQEKQLLFPSGLGVTASLLAWAGSFLLFHPRLQAF